MSSAELSCDTKHILISDSFGLGDKCTIRMWADMGDSPPALCTLCTGSPALLQPAHCLASPPICSLAFLSKPELRRAARVGW